MASYSDAIVPASITLVGTYQINGVTTGNTVTIGPATAGRRWVVLAMSLSATAATAFTFNNGGRQVNVGTVLIETVWPWNPAGWVRTTDGTALSVGIVGGTGYGTIVYGYEG